MTKTRIINLSVVLITLCCVCLLASCAPIDSGTSEVSSAVKKNCSIICSEHSNSKNSTSGLDEYVRNTWKSNGKLSFILLDGSPKQTNEDMTSNSSDRKNKEAINDCVNSIKNIKAESEEVDVLRAFERANECLPSVSDKTENTVVFIGTGLSTKGVVNFVENDLSKIDLNNYLSWIKNSGQLPKLKNINKVVWYGFSEVNTPQEEFTTTNFKETLKNFYINLLSEAGIDKDKIEISDSLPGGATTPSNNLPKVTTVKMPPKPKFNAGSETELSADVLFNGDSSTFLTGTNPSENADLIEIANSAKINNLKLKITGYTAHHQTSAEGGNESLSKNRAEAVKNLLISMGCSADNIETVGGGYGPYDNDQANRCVQIQFS